MFDLEVRLSTDISKRELARRLKTVCSDAWRLKAQTRWGIPIRGRYVLSLAEHDDLFSVLGILRDGQSVVETVAEIGADDRDLPSAVADDRHFAGEHVAVGAY